MMNDEQPTNEELKEALIDAFFAEPHDRQAKIDALREIRKKRTTWCFRDENKLRAGIDRFLDGE